MAKPALVWHLLQAVAILVGLFGLAEGMAFYWELATLVTIMLLGHWMEMRAVGSAQSALKELAKLLRLVGLSSLRLF